MALFLLYIINLKEKSEINKHVNHLPLGNLSYGIILALYKTIVCLVRQVLFASWSMHQHVDLFKHGAVELQVFLHYPLS